MKREDLLLAAKYVDQDGDEGIQSAIALVGKEITAAMFVIHLRKDLNPPGQYPLSPETNKKIERMLLSNGFFEINRFRDKYRFLSNFWLCDFIYKSMQFKSVEQGFQFFMTLDNAMRDKILAAVTSGEAKKIAMDPSFPLRPDWKEVQIEIMAGLLKKKFSIKNNPELAYGLYFTDDFTLKEGNDWGDTFWGICNGIGEDNLGKLLMARRDYIVAFVEKLKKLKEFLPWNSILDTTEDQYISGADLYKWLQMLGIEN